MSLKFLNLNFFLHTQNGYKCYTVFLYLCTRGITTVTSSVARVASAIKGADTGESSARDAREPSLASRVRPTLHSLLLRRPRGRNSGVGEYLTGETTGSDK